MSTSPVLPGLNYNSTTDPRKIANNQRQNIYQQGQDLSQLYNNDYTANAGQKSQTADYLSGIENPIAQGNGGYNASETSQIQMTPQQQQDIVNNAGISAGVNTAANKEAADRSVAAAGGNPLAEAAYGQRAALQSGTAAANAETGARVDASNAAATREENIGQTRLGQQDQALGYYQGQNQQANQNQQNDLSQQNQTYGTMSNAGNSASGLGVQASQTPSTFDKVLGGIAGFLEDGSAGGSTAIIGEGGPEKVVDMRYMDQGGSPAGSGVGEPTDGTSTPAVPWYKKLAQQWAQKPQVMPGQTQQQPMQGQQPGWNPTTPYNQIGQAAGKGVSMLTQAGFLEHGSAGQGKGGIFTEPTKVKLEPYEGVVPLNKKPNAKLRPNMATLPAAQPTGGRMYGS